MENLPNQSILLAPGNNNRKNYFQSQIFKDLQKNESNEDKGQKEKLMKELEDILKWCICYQYLDNPVSDPTSCPHYACKACFDQYFQKKRSNTIPCPICRKTIRKRNLIKIPIVESIKELLKDVQNSGTDENNINTDEKCKVHPKNPVFFICLDCQVKMCAVCDEERKKHEKHHLVNYERYVKLFSFIQNNFAGIKQNIAEREKMIKEFRELILLSEKQKKAYLQCLSDIASKIQNYYQKNLEKMNQMIAENMELIAKYRNFMSNVKSHISSQFKSPYDDLENIEDIEDKIKQRVEKLKIKQIDNKSYEYLKKNSTPNLTGVLPKKIPITFKKNLFLNNSHVKCKADKEGIYTFGLELSEDKKIINAYLDAKKMIKNRINNSAYVVFIEFGKHKRYYLESTEPAVEGVYSYENNFNVEELTDTKDVDIEIILNILSISLE